VKLKDAPPSSGAGAERLGEASGAEKAIDASKPTAAQIEATVKATQAAVKARLKKDSQKETEDKKNMGKPTEGQVKYAKKLGILKADVKEKAKREDVSRRAHYWLERRVYRGCNLK